jgi:hypothetical protein
VTTVSAQPIRLAIADDHALFRQGLKAVLNRMLKKSPAGDG